MNNIDILEEMIKPIATRTFIFPDGRKEEKEIYNLERKQIEAIENLIAENKELKEFKENIEKIDKKQLDKLYKDAQKALKEYRETQNKVAKLEEENKELKEKNKRYEEIYKNYGIDDLVQELEKYRVENKELKEDKKKTIVMGGAEYISKFIVKENYIPKSKVEEKIEEIEKKFKEETNPNILVTLKILKDEMQSLLGKE